jgi:hypothetical protein
MLALVGIVAIAAIIGVNFKDGLARWNDPNEAWLVGDLKTGLDNLRGAIDENAEGRPVVFVVDDEIEEPVRIYGFVKFGANVLRYGLPHGSLDHGYIFLGSLEDAIAGTATQRGDETYNELSTDAQDVIDEGLAENGEEPIYVLPYHEGAPLDINTTGANAELAQLDSVGTEEAEVWVMRDGEVLAAGQPVAGEDESGGGLVAILRALGGILVMLVPGYLLFRALIPDGGVAEALGLVPVLAFSALAAVATLLIGVTRAPFSSGWALAALGLTILLSAAAYLRAPGRTAPTAGP